MHCCPPASVAFATWCCSVSCLSSLVCFTRWLGCSPLSDSGFAAAYYSSQTSRTDEASICFCPGCFCTSVCPLRTPIQLSPRPKETFPVLFLTLILLRLPVWEWYTLAGAQMFKSSQIKCVCVCVRACVCVAIRLWIFLC